MPSVRHHQQSVVSRPKRRRPTAHAQGVTHSAASCIEPSWEEQALELVILPLDGPLLIAGIAVLERLRTTSKSYEALSQACTQGMQRRCEALISGALPQDVIDVPLGRALPHLWPHLSDHKRRHLFEGLCDAGYFELTLHLFDLMIGDKPVQASAVPALCGASKHGRVDILTHLFKRYPELRTSQLLCNAMAEAAWYNRRDVFALVYSLCPKEDAAACLTFLRAEEDGRALSWYLEAQKNPGL